tara:strand:+ start:238 stop:384 length:147 start_codon:yes stop_codon:yes gene_type:complete
MNVQDTNEDERSTDLQEVLNILNTFGGSEIWQLEWLIDRVEQTDCGKS